jgi:hypothetical protein
MATVYIETSIIGYMTARSNDAVIFLARQQLTRQWWTDQRARLGSRHEPACDW